MLGIRPAGQALAAITLAIGGLIAATATGAQASDRTLCDYQVASVSGGLYTVQNNKWGSSAAECVTTDGGADFTVANSAISNQWSPGGYPSIFMGCHWGDCTRGGLAANPLPIAGMALDHVTSSWSVSTPGGSGNVYDVAYDIWTNQTPTTSGQPNGTEIMVWLGHHDSVEPAGAIVADGVWIDGYQYNIWRTAGSGPGGVVTYQMTSQRNAVTGLNIGDLVLNSELSGYISPLWYLIAVEAGFEIWRGGTGLATNSFSVNLASVLPVWPTAGSASPPPPISQPYRRTNR